jgi:hypothetical protein
MELVVYCVLAFLHDGNDTEEVISDHVFHLWSCWIDLDKKTIDIVEGVCTHICEISLQKLHFTNFSKNFLFHKIQNSLTYNIFDAFSIMVNT